MAGCLWSGGEGLYLALENQTPTTLSYDDLSRGRPTAKWLMLTNCVLAVHDSAYRVTKSEDHNGSGRVTEAFVPVRGAGETNESRPRAVLATKDPQILSTLDRLRRITNESEYVDFLARHGSFLTLQRPVSGMVSVGAGETGSRSSLSGSGRSLAGDYILLSEGSRPSVARSLGLVLLGLLLSVGTLIVARNESPEEIKTP